MPILSGTIEARGGDWRARVEPVAASALGLVVPLLLFGRTALAVAAAVAIVGLFATAHRSRLAGGINEAMKTPLGALVWLTFALWLVSVAGSVEVGRSIEVWLRMAALLVVGTGLCVLLRARRDLHRLALQALVAGAAVCGALAPVALTVAAQPYVWLMGHGDDAGGPALVASQVMKSYGTALALAMPAVLWAGFRLGGGWRWAALAYQALAALALFLLASRAGLLGGGLGIGLLACWYAVRQKRGWMLLLLVPVVAGAVAYVFLDNQRNNEIEAALGLPAWLVDAHRQTIWHHSLSYVELAPWFGTGPDTINHLPGAEDIVPGSYVNYVPSHPHNFAIEVLVETGAVGLAAMLVTLALLAAGLVRAVRRDGAAAVALVAMCVTFWLVNLISYSFWSYWWQASWVLLTALVAVPLTPGLMTGGFTGRRR